MITVSTYKQQRKGGKTRLYFRYLKDGKRISVPFKDYLYTSPTTKKEIRHNRECEFMINRIIQEMEEELLLKVSGRSYLLKIEHKLSSFVEVLRDEKLNQNQQIGSYNSLIKFIKKDLDDIVTMKTINVPWLQETKTKLMKTSRLSRNTQSSYFSILKSILNEAENRGYLQKSPSFAVRNIPSKPIHKDFLTVDEIKLLITTDCANPHVKNAFLFACMVGLRACDLESLMVKDIEEWEGLRKITITQKKTLQLATVVLPDISHDFIGNDSGYRLFNLPSVSSRNKHIKNWISSAGIEKNISFNSSRHSFAMILATEGFNQYALKKALGHKLDGAINNYLHYSKKSLTKQKELMDSLFNDDLDSTNNTIRINKPPIHSHLKVI